MSYNYSKKVELVQEILVKSGYNIDIDGKFGPITEEAVVDFVFNNFEPTVKNQNVEDDSINKILTLLNTDRKINKIIYHCSATVEGKDYTVDDIRRWHKSRGFNDIGYHFVVYRDGSLHLGRPINKIGAHTKGHNTESIGIVYIGGLDTLKNPKDTRTEEQKRTLKAFSEACKQKFVGAEQLGHYQTGANKACPCFNAKAEYN